MGNHPTKSHSLAQRKLGGRWQTIGRTPYQSTIIKNTLTGEEAQMQTIQTWSSDAELQLYDARSMPLHNVVQVYTVEAPNKEQVCRPDVLQVVTQRIPHRLAEARNMSLGESLFVLHQSLQGYKEIHEGLGLRLVDVSDRMIGITSTGDVKVWINERFGDNAIEADGLQPGYPNAPSKIRLFLLNLFNIVETHTAGNYFPQDLRNKWNPSTFSEGQVVVERYCQKRGITMLRVNEQSQGGGIVSNVQPSQFPSNAKQNKTVYASTIIRETAVPMEVQQAQARAVVSVVPSMATQSYAVGSIPIATPSPNILIQEGPSYVQFAPPAQVRQMVPVASPAPRIRTTENLSAVEYKTVATLPTQLTNVREVRSATQAPQAVRNITKEQAELKKFDIANNEPRQPSPRLATGRQPQQTLKPSTSARNLEVRRSPSPINKDKSLDQKSMGQIDRRIFEKKESLEIDKAISNLSGKHNENMNVGVQVRPQQSLGGKTEPKSIGKDGPRQLRVPAPNLTTNSVQQSPSAAKKMQPIIRISANGPNGPHLSNGLPHLSRQAAPQNTPQLHAQVPQQMGARNPSYSPIPHNHQAPYHLGQNRPTLNGQFAYGYDPTRMSYPLNKTQFSPSSPNFNQENQPQKQHSALDSSKSLEEHLLEIHKPGIEINRESKLNIQTTEYTNQNSYFFKPEQENHYSHPWIEHSEEKLQKKASEPKSPKKQKDPQPIEIIEAKSEEKAPEKRPQLVVNYDDQPHEEVDQGSHEQALNMLTVPVIQIMEYMPEKGVQFPEPQRLEQHIEYRAPSKIAVSYAETEIPRPPISPRQHEEHLTHIRKQSGPYEHIFHSEDGEDHNNLGQDGMEEEDEEDEVDEDDQDTDNHQNRGLLEAGARIILDEDQGADDSPVKQTSSLILGADRPMPKKVVSKYETVLVDSMEKKNEKQPQRYQEKQRYEGRYENKAQNKYESRYEANKDSKYDNFQARYGSYESKYRLEQQPRYESKFEYNRSYNTPNFSSGLTDYKNDDYSYLRKYQNVSSNVGNVDNILIYDTSFTSLSNPKTTTIPDKIKKYDYGVSKYEDSKAGTSIASEIDQLIRKYEKSKTDAGRHQRGVSSTSTLPPQQHNDTNRYARRGHRLNIAEDEPIIVFTEKPSPRSHRKSHVSKGHSSSVAVSYDDLRRYLHQS